MKIFILSLLSTMVCATLSMAQGVKIYKGDATSTDTSIREFIKVKASADGGMVYLGQADEGSDANISLTKTNLDGTIAWQKVYQAPGLDVAKNFIVNTNGSYTIVGGTDNTGNSSDPSDILVVKVNKDGELKWMKTYGGSDDDEGFGVTEMNDGTLIVTGTTYSFGNANKNAFAGRIDTTDGTTVWSNAYSQGRFNYFLDAIALPNGDAVLCGYTWVLGGGNTSVFDPFFVKVGFDGDIIWAHRLKMAGSQIIYGYEKDVDGGILYAGVSTVGTGSNQNLIGKITSEGLNQWARLFGTTAGDRIWDMAVLPTGDYVVAGFNDKQNIDLSKKNGFVARLNNQGLVQQAITYGVGDTNTTTFTGVAVEGQMVTASGLTYMYGNTRGAALVTKLLWSDLSQNCQATSIATTSTTIASTDSSGASFSPGGASVDLDATTATNNLIVEDQCTFTSTVRALNEPDFQVFPNPSRAVLKIENAKAGQIQIFNSLGQRVVEATSNGESLQKIDIRHLSKGSYQIKLVSEGGQVSVSRLLVE